MSHLLSAIDYHEVELPKVKLPERAILSKTYERPSHSLSTYVDEQVARLMGDR
ncbi:MAG: polyphosphate kinase 2 [Mycobacterium sp.]|nr:polyphosphate kinase 2 [Mycobacterium sp.]